MRFASAFALLPAAAAKCQDLDAILVEPQSGKFPGKAYFFQDSGYIKYDADQDKPVTTAPSAIDKGWRGLPNDLDGILTEPAEGANAGFAFVFKGSQVWKWDAKSDSLADGPADFAKTWPGLPADFYSGIDTVMAETSTGREPGVASFFSGDKYAKFDLKNHSALPGFPRSIAEDWPGMPDSGIDAILVEPTGASLKKYAYFFKGQQYWKWDMSEGKAVAGPKDIVAGWSVCFSKPSAEPEQVHLALGLTDDSMAVSWATGLEVEHEVQWGLSADSLTNTAKGDSRAFTQDAGRTWYTHAATMTGLKMSQRYFYRVGVEGNWTQTFSFVNRRQGAPYRHVILGDLGASCGFTVCKACTAGSEICDASTCAGNTSKGLVSEVGQADLFLHMGDFGYDLDSNNGLTGDQFMRNIEQLAAYVPYMVSHGNHENSALPLAHFAERFRHMPANGEPATFKSANGETANSLYFSWDYGLVHYVSMSTEIWFGVTDGKVTKEAFLKWLRKDLEAANKNRERFPWILVNAHRSVYCSCDGDCDEAAVLVRDDLEEIFMEYGVDLFINGHEHNYERSFPIYKGKSDPSSVEPKAPIYIVSGSAGSREMHEPFTRKQPSWSAFRSDAFSYSVLTAHNASHIHWQQIATDPTEFPGSEYGKVLDETWIVQSNHGPFNKSLAPKGVAFPEGERHVARQHEHWLPLLDFKDEERLSSSGEELASHEMIQNFREREGEIAWQRKLNGLMNWVQEALGAEISWRGSQGVLWEDVRDDGSSDCATCDKDKVIV